ncbi:DUF4132 domain-containing protein [Bartonella sp. HY038]|uniref:DUF4132 domain-containing protein n=1 Tax=Bartonella sp. HY038 TaxID=2759660 RepID=UPI0015FA3F46|nr:DUF4132 domain-containing protein [Bartonella sp. HY038]
MSLLKSIKEFFYPKNALNSDSNSDSDGSRVQAGTNTLNLEHLKKIFATAGLDDPHLINDLCRYMENGQNESVLLRLSPTSSHGSFSFYEINKSFTAALGNVWQPFAFIRLGKIFAQLRPIGGKNFVHFGSELSPDWWRHCLTFAYMPCNKHCTFIFSGDQHKGLELTAPRLIELAHFGGATINNILDVVLTLTVSQFGANEVDTFPGIEHWLKQQSQEISQSCAHLPTRQFAQLLGVIGGFNLGDHYLDILIPALMQNTKTVHGNAITALTSANKDKVVSKLRDIYADQTPAIRHQIIVATTIILKHRASELFHEWLKKEKTLKLKDAMAQQITMLNNGLTENLEQDCAGSYVAIDGSTVTIPPYDVEKEKSYIALNIIDKKYYTDFYQAVENFNAFYALEKNEKNKDGSWHWTDYSKPIDSDLALAALKDVLQGKLPTSNILIELYEHVTRRDFDHSGCVNIFKIPNLSLFQMMLLARKTKDYNYLSIVFSAQEDLSLKSQIINQIDMFGDWRIFDYILTQNLGEESLIHELSGPYGPYYRDEINLSDSQLFWPLITENLSYIDKAVGLLPIENKVDYSLSAAFDLLKMLPKLPLSYVPPLMLIAMGRAVNGRAVSREDREYARQLLSPLPNLDASIAHFLKDGQQELRTAAANWLKDRKAITEITALQAAIKKEKSDGARAALLSALNIMGADISSYFAPEKLLLDAEKGLKKTKVKGLDWFPFAQVPSLNWKNGTLVDPIIVKWWITLTAKLKQPQGNQMMRLWLDQLKPESANELGLFILHTWITEDTLTYNEDEAFAYANTHTDQRLQENLRYIKIYPNAESYVLTDRDLIFKQLYESAFEYYKQSAVDSKGILALASHIDDIQLVAIARDYIKKHGSRVSQSKAMMDMLVGNSSSPAIQVILSAARRIKQKSLQDHAKQLIKDIADRHDWTFDQLADRTIPMVGLSENGEAELDCGKGRIYRLKLSDDNSISIINDKGKGVKTLPTPNLNDAQDVKTINDAKKIVSTAKKELKQLITLQTARLHEAMCLERLWPIDEWQAYIFNHPIMRTIVTKLIWIGMNEDGKTIVTFRPLEDGSLTDNHDNAVSLDQIATVKLAHISLLDEADIKAWRTHLTDYEIKPPFKQLRDDLPRITKDVGNQTHLNDRQGFMIDTYKLRTIATKLGYHRGAGDGEHFDTYVRHYASANIDVQIEFTGNELPEKNLPAALIEVVFMKVKNGGHYQRPITDLEKIPMVLLAESMGDYHAIAAAGTGFDEDWQTKSAF